MEPVTPPEELLTEPRQTQVEGLRWTVVARNRKVNRAWEELIRRASNNAARCYRDLCTAPMTRQSGRVFPLKGSVFKGVWEYEVTAGDRVFYIPDSARRKVVVYYAGRHAEPAPLPPR